MDCRFSSEATGERASVVALLFAVASPHAGAVAPDGGTGEAEVAVATVNGEPITRAELVNELLIRHGKAVLEDMIRQRAVEQEMARAGISVSEYEIDTELDRERRSFAAKGRKLEEMVAEKYQMSMEGYRAVMRRWLLIRKVIVRRASPSDIDVLRWFLRNRERLYDTPAEITVRHIFIARKDPHSMRERTDADVEARIAAVRSGLARGDGFARLARRYSDNPVTRKKGGALGTVNENAAIAHLERPFVEAMMMLKPGPFGGPVETRKGFHFLQVTARKEGRKAEYEDFKAVARADYLEERAETLKESFLRELMQRTKVTKSFEPPERKRREDARPEDEKGLGD